ncbi:Calcium-binding protein cml42 [Thalictrum thalictroides]|uniref:Calcium-binding protein cml42 n=1 Tax=Thalictrum thalictroides TaxID=46969 RepID=A0A7J6WXA5_THATH|nr:Calcium-binding protein cml42 [Thalictrum thalictroides]
MSILKSNDFQNIFEKLDENGDGHVSVEELCCFLSKVDVHISHDDLESIVGTKSFDLEEFMLFCDTMYKQGEEGKQTKVGVCSSDDSDLVEAFKVFDINNDGFITSDELQCVLSRLGLWEERSGRDCKRMIYEFDINSDGVLDFEEFKKMMLMT